jgi:hypothetical protein
MFRGDDRSKVEETLTDKGAESISGGEEEVVAGIPEEEGEGSSVSREGGLEPVEEESQREMFSAAFSSSERDKKR